MTTRRRAPPSSSPSSSPSPRPSDAVTKTQTKSTSSSAPPPPVIDDLYRHQSPNAISARAKGKGRMGYESERDWLERERDWLRERDRLEKEKTASEAERQERVWGMQERERDWLEREKAAREAERKERVWGMQETERKREMAIERAAEREEREQERRERAEERAERDKARRERAEERQERAAERRERARERSMERRERARERRERARERRERAKEREEARSMETLNTVDSLSSGMVGASATIVTSLLGFHPMTADGLSLRNGLGYAAAAVLGFNAFVLAGVGPMLNRCVSPAVFGWFTFALRALVGIVVLVMAYFITSLYKLHL